METPLLDGIKKEAIYSATTGLNINRQLWLKAFFNRAQRIGQANVADTIRRTGAKGLTFQEKMKTPLVQHLMHDEASEVRHLDKVKKLFSMPVTSRVPVGPKGRTVEVDRMNTLLTGKTPTAWAAKRLQTMSTDRLLGMGDQYNSIINSAQPIKRNLTKNLFR